eukprot:scaffold63476_cov63-Phaeocystis_antarctica.AAC.1
MANALYRSPLLVCGGHARYKSYASTRESARIERDEQSCEPVVVCAFLAVRVEYRHRGVL